MDALEFNCPMCSRCIVLRTGISPSSWADRYATVPFECSAERGGACGWTGCLFLSEGAAVAGTGDELRLSSSNAEVPIRMVSLL